MIDNIRVTTYDLVLAGKIECNFSERFHELSFFNFKILKFPSMFNQAHKLSVKAFHQMEEAGIFAAEDRVELIKGMLIDMSPVGPSHTSRVKILSKLFFRLLIDQASIGIQDPVVLDDFSEPIPDISNLKWRQDEYAKAHPRPEDIILLIEVADSSLAKDRAEKIPMYAESGVSESWLINLPEKRIEVYKQPMDGKYQQVELIESNGALQIEAFGLVLAAKDLLR
jgi:Uma2 family endonuclease